MKECRQCVTLIKHDEEICRECREFDPEPVDWQAKAQELKKLADSFKGKGDKYDFIVLLTGGKDSSFTLYYMTKVLNARVIAFTWDNKLIQKGAWTNINNAIEATGVDHHICQWEGDTTKRIFRMMFRQYGRVCFCVFWLRLFVIPFAVKERIPLIITGESEGQRLGDHTFELPTPEDNLDQIKNFYGVFYLMHKVAAKKQDPALLEVLNNQVFGPLKECVDRGLNNSFPVFVPLSNYVSWVDKDEIKELLKEHLDWQCPEDLYVHTSCSIEPIKGYMEYKSGLAETRSELSVSIRTGGVSREEALKDLQLMNMDGIRPDEAIKGFCNTFDISEEEFDEYLGRMYSDSKNILMNLIRRFYIKPRLSKVTKWIFGPKNEYGVWSKE